MRRLLLLACALLGAACSRSPEPAPPAAGKDVALVEPRVSLGRTVPGGFLRGTIGIRAGAEGATIIQVSPSCGCTISEVRVPVTLGPHETFEAPIAIDLSRLTDLGAGKDGAPRTLERTVSIVSQRGTELTATLVTEVSERIRVMPAQVRFASLVPGRTDSVPVEITSAPGVPQPALLSVDAGTGVTWTPEPTASGAPGIRGLLTWAPTQPTDLDRIITFRLDDPRDPEVRIQAFGHGDTAVSVNPETIESLAAPTNKPVVVLVTLHRRDGLPLEILGASCTAHRVELTVHAGEGPVRTLRVVVPVLPLPGEILGTITVRTNVDGIGPLEIPVHVRAAG